MPNIASAKKRVRTTAKRTAINTARKTRVRGFIRKVEEAIASGDKKAALACMEAFGTTDFRDDLPNVTVPALVLHGDDPRALGERRVDRVADRAGAGDVQ